jgi:hypothetical protein
MRVFLHSEAAGRDRSWFAMALGKAAQLVVETERLAAHRSEDTGGGWPGDSAEGPRPRASQPSQNARFEATRSSATPPDNQTDPHA